MTSRESSGIKTPKGTWGMTPKQDEFIRNNAETMNVTRMAEALGCSSGKVRAYAQKHRIGIHSICRHCKSPYLECFRHTS